MAAQLALLALSHGLCMCRDGLLLLRVIEHVEPGTVDWHKVCVCPTSLYPAVASPQAEMRPTHSVKKAANCQYAIELGQKLGLRLVSGALGSKAPRLTLLCFAKRQVNMSGLDLVQTRNAKLLSAFMWQLMRYHVLKFLSSMGTWACMI